MRKADDDPHHFLSEDIKKAQPYQMKQRHSLPRQSLLSKEPLTEHGTSPVEQEEFVESCLTDVCVVACSDIVRRNVSRIVRVMVSQFLHHHLLFCMYKMSCNAMFMT